MNSPVETASRFQALQVAHGSSPTTFIPVEPERSGELEGVRGSGMWCCSPAAWLIQPLSLHSHHSNRWHLKPPTKELRTKNCLTFWKNTLWRLCRAECNLFVYLQFTTLVLVLHGVCIHIAILQTSSMLTVLFPFQEKYSDRLTCLGLSGSIAT